MNGWATLAYDCTAEDLETTQVFVEGPETPPQGSGSLKFDLSDKDGNFTDLFRTDEYDGLPLSGIRQLSYSTYVETEGSQPPYLRLTIDLDDDGVRDESLFFYPANNADQQAIAVGEWQTWDVFGGRVNVDGDSGPDGAMTWDEYLDSRAEDNPTIVESFEGGPEAGGFTIGTGCGGAGTAGSVTYIDLPTIGLADGGVDKYDLETKAQARTLTVSPASGPAGTTLTVSGTDCWEDEAHAFLFRGDERIDAENDIPVKEDRTWSTTGLSIPAGSDPNATYVVRATCGGPTAGAAFAYGEKPFDVTPTTVAQNPNTPTGANGYRMVAADGGIFTFGARNFHGSTGAMKLNKPIVGGATDVSDYDGYWIVASDGGVFTFNAPFFGSLGGTPLPSPAVEIEPTPTGDGYWIVLANGRVHAFGGAKHYGDMSTRALNKPVIGMSVAPDGMGYWLVAEDGGIFNFGSAKFFGSTGAMRLNAPVIDLAPMPDGQGYYLVAKDGGVFTFGTALFKGSTGNMRLNQPVIAMLVAPNGTGYWLAASDGGIFTFGNVDFLGSMGGTRLNSPVLDLIN
ncbi:MAG TPA: hypothetical protein VM345_09360 [Acidimicrobiales bacterium]|nr:hypothetical protein [Acidimicrobiales bacterium]